MVRSKLTDTALEELVDQAGDDGYRLYVESLRWPEGVACPRCNSQRLHWLDGRDKHHCRDCRYQFRVTAGTVLHGSHVSLRYWLEAVSLILASDAGYPATELHRVLGGSYKTAWFVEHRIRAALGGHAEIEHPISLVASADAALSTTEFRPSSEAPQSLGVFTHLIAGAYRNTSFKYLTAYWNESRWRAEQRGKATAFRDTVAALLRSPPLPYERLVASAAPLIRP